MSGSRPQGPYGKGLGESRDSLHEDVSVREESDQETFDHGLLPHDHASHLVEEPVHEAARLPDPRLYDFDVSVHATLGLSGLWLKGFKSSDRQY